MESNSRPEPNPKLDARVCRHIGIIPTVQPYVSGDDGQSMVAWVSSDGPWYSEQQLGTWLDGKHAKEELIGYEIYYGEVFPPVSTDDGAAMNALKTFLVLGSDLGACAGITMQANGWSDVAIFWTEKDGTEQTVEAERKTFAEAFCAAIMAHKELHGDKD